MKRILNNRLVLSLLILLSAACSNDKKENGLSFNEKIKLRQYLVQGESLYLNHCSNCHSADGTGLRLLIPPLTDKTYIRENQNQLACILKFGLTGTININSNSYNETMPANPTLTSLEIAEILTYIGNSWGNELGIIDTDYVSKSLINCTATQ